MKLLRLASLISLFCGSLWAQGSYQPILVQTPTGSAIAGASVAICSGQPTLTTPCGGSTLQQTYTDITESTGCTLNPVTLGPPSGVGCTNPGLTDGFGMARFYADSGFRYYQVYGQAIVVTDVEPVQFGGTGGGGGSTVQGTPNQIDATTGNPQILSIANPLMTPGPASVNGIFTVQGPILNELAMVSDGQCPQAVQSVNPGAATVGTFCFLQQSGSPIQPVFGNGQFNLALSTNIPQLAAPSNGQVYTYCGPEQGFDLPQNCSTNATIPIPEIVANTTNCNSGTAVGGDGLGCINVGGGGGGAVLLTPSATQTIAQPVSTSLNTNVQNNIFTANQFNWTQSPSGTLTSTISATVTLTPCPVGIDTTAADLYSIHIGTVGTPEDALVTAGSCTSGAASGTITFTPALNHAAGYTISSSSAGFQEASNAAAFTPTSPTGTNQTGVVMAAPGQYTWTNTVYIHKSNQILDFSGVIITCQMSATCLYVSTPTLGANGTTNVTIWNFRGQATVSGGGFPMIEDNANNTWLEHVTTRNTQTCSPFCAFSNLIKVDNDQSFVIDRLDDSVGNWSICNSVNGCSIDILISGSPNAGTGVIQNSNFTGGCGSNYVRDDANNTLSIKTSVMQGWNSYAIQFGGSGGSNNPELTMDHVYMESGGCTNYLGLNGNAGIINLGGTLKQTGATGASAILPIYSNTGSTQYAYYVVVHSSTGSVVSMPIFAGYALVNPAAATSIPVNWYQVGSTGTITYDLLRTTSTTDAPTGTSTYAVATGLTVGSTCTANVCSFVDTANVTPSSYTVANQTYIPMLSYWPAAINLTSPVDNATPLQVATFYTDKVAKGAGIVVDDASEVHIFAQECASGNKPIFGLMSCLGGDPQGNANAAVAGTVLTSGPVSGSATANLKGRLNFSGSFLSSLNTGDIITLVDSSPYRTAGNTVNRPTLDTADAAICSDLASSLNAAQICLRAPLAISNYINSAPDGSSWLERLTASVKTFKVPITTNSQITSTVATSTPPLVVTSTTPVVNLTTGPTTYNSSGTQQTNTKFLKDTCTLGTNCAVTLTGGAVYTNSSSYDCFPRDATTPANAVTVARVSGSAVTFTGTGTDVINYMCVGN